MGVSGGSSNAHGSARRLAPSLLALLGFIPLGLLLWWALAGPRPVPTPLDWSSLGLEVRDAPDDPPAFPLAHDLEWVRSRMVGWQADLGGQLTRPLPIGEGRYAAVVRQGDGGALSPLPELAGVVEWSAGEDDAVRCGFSEPVTLNRLEDTHDDADSEVSVELTALSGRCTDDGPVVAVPVVRKHVVPLSFPERLGGERPEEALVAYGVLLVQPDGTIDAEAALEPELGLAAYPWEIARATMLQAVPENPAAATGSWADPVYPVLLPAGDRLWWVMPLAPLDGATRLTGYLLTAADEFTSGVLNPIERYWLDEPVTGPASIIGWGQDVLEHLGTDDAAPVVRPGLPSAEGQWHGRVSTADEQLRYVLEASSDGEVCLADPEGSTISCRQDGEISRR
jgi:hypothetical protein